MRKHPVALLCALVLVVAAVGCSDDDPAGPGAPPEGLVPDFALTDVNPTSATHDTEVSPRDYLAQVSAWYFGHAT